MGTEGARAQIGTQHESQVLERCLDGLHCEAGCRAHFLKPGCIYIGAARGWQSQATPGPPQHLLAVQICVGGGRADLSTEL